MMELPKFHETFDPILDILRDENTYASRDMQNLVIEKYYSHLPENLLTEKTQSGENLLYNRIAWGKSYLKKGGFIFYPQRGYVKITPKGLQQKEKLSLSAVEGDNNLLNFYKHESIKENFDETSVVNSSSPQDLIEKGVAQIKSETKIDLLERLKTIDPYYFERVILKLLEKMGYGEFKVTPKSSDGGIDGIINEDKLGLDKIYIQAKRFNANKVREIDIRNFIGAMSGDTNKGVFVTTSFFDQGAIKKAENAHHKIILIDGIKLVDLMHEFNVGVQVKAIYEVKQLDEDFFLDQ